MRPILAIAAKDIRQLLRDRVGGFFVFFFPALIGIFFGFIFAGGSGPSGIGVAVVNEDGSPRSVALVDSLAQSEAFSITTLETWDAALQRVSAGDSAAAVRIPAGFDDALAGFFRGQPAEIELAIDPARQFSRGVVEGLVTRAAFEQAARSFTDPDLARKLIADSRASIDTADNLAPIQRLALHQLFGSVEGVIENVLEDPEDPAAEGAAEAADAGPAFNPVRINVTSVVADADGPPNSFSWTIPMANAWALFGCVMGFTASVVLERSRGTLIRLRMAPISTAQLLAGKSLACFASATFVQCMLLAVGVIVFGVRPQSPILLALAVVCGGVGFVGIAMLLSVIGKTEQATQGIAQAAMLVLAMAGGAGVPIFVMPSWMQTAASISPFMWLIRAHDGAIWRGFSLSQMLLPLGVLLAIGAVCFTLGAIIFTRRLARD